MRNKFKYIQRRILRPKLNKRCACRGKICTRSQVLYSFGVNDGNSSRILLREVNVEETTIDHVWVKSNDLNNFRKYKKGAIITFDALISSYQKMGGRVGIGLIDLQNIEVMN